MENKQVARTVQQYSGSSGQSVERSVVREVPLTVSVNGKELITLLTTGDANRELAVGFLLSEGFLSSREDLKSIRVDDQAGVAEVDVAADGERAGQRSHGRFDLSRPRLDRGGNLVVPAEVQ